MVIDESLYPDVCFVLPVLNFDKARPDTFRQNIASAPSIQGCPDGSIHALSGWIPTHDAQSRAGSRLVRIEELLFECEIESCDPQ